MLKPRLGWFRLLQVGLHERLMVRPNLRKNLTNIGWLLADKVVRLVVGLIVWAWMARYLGPEQFGLLNFASAFVGLFAVVASLGLNSIVVRDLVKAPDTANSTLGTAFILQLFGGALAFALAVFVVNKVRAEDDLAKAMVAVLGSVMILKSSEVVKYWFESKVCSKYTVWLENCSFLVFSAIKLLLILSGADLMVMVWVIFTEGAFVAVGLLCVYELRGGCLSSWRANYQRAKTLLEDSWPLILSGLAIMVYMRIDQIMIGQMLGNESVGLYSSAVRISEVWYFIPMTVASSLFPSIIDARKNNSRRYYRYLQRLYDLMVLIAVVLALPTSIGSHWILQYLFGEAYVSAAPALAIHAWSAVFVFLGVASGNWFLLENMQKQAFYRTVLGAIVNVLANFFLIPNFGVAGAALGTLASQVFAAYLFDYCGIKTRKSFWLKSASLFPFITGLRVRGP